MTKYDKYKNLLSEMNQLAPAKSGTKVQPYSDAHTAWLVGTLPEQVMAFYGVKYREEAVPPSDISPTWRHTRSLRGCGSLTSSDSVGPNGPTRGQ